MVRFLSGCMSEVMAASHGPKLAWSHDAVRPSGVPAITTAAQWSVVGELLHPGVKHLLSCRHKSFFYVRTVEMFSATRLPSSPGGPLAPRGAVGGWGDTKKLVRAFGGRMKRLFWMFQKRRRRRRRRG